ncbi:hypothetical protein QE152_g35811 [Popillia japonica]|uniref:Uncharacterized protein n=1 Tax=Popillia japonica TaxID=7064 RepID=A0AAW1IEX8_POPJA
MSLKVLANLMEQYQEKTDEELRKLVESISEINLEELWKTFKTILRNVATVVCGIGKTTNRKKLTHWWNEELQQVMPYQSTKEDEDRIWCVSSLQIKLDRERLREALNEINTDDLTTSAKGFTGVLTKVCNAAMPKRKSIPNKQPAYWWNTTVAELRRECVEARRRYSRSRSRGSSQANLHRSGTS